MKRYGLTHFKIKLAGDAQRDVERLRAVARVIPHAVAFTLDGNENFRDVEHFGEFWERYLRGPESSADASTWETELDVVLG